MDKELIAKLCTMYANGVKAYDIMRELKISPKQYKECLDKYYRIDKTKQINFILKMSKV